jgi:hypothetical protein
MCCNPGRSCSGVDGPWHCRGAKKALGIIWLLCSDTLSVRLCWLGPASTRCGFWRLLGGEGIRLEGLMSGPESPRAPKASRGVCPLVSRPKRDPLEEWLIVPHLLGNTGEPPSHGRSRRPSPAWALAGAKGRGPRIRLRLLSIRSLRLGRAPKP